jgi:hypothetical protein
MDTDQYRWRGARKALLVTATWLAATAGATALGWRSVTFVTAQVTDQPARVLNVASLDTAAARAKPAPGVPDGTTTSSVSAGSSSSVGVTPTTITSGPAGSTGSAGTASPDSSTPDSSTPDTSIAGSSTTRHPSTTRGPVDTRAQTTAPTVAATTQTNSTPGGVTTVACHGSQPELISASPNQSYTVSVDTGDQSSDNPHIDVQYSSSHHQYTVTATCRNSQPTFTVSADGRRD